MAEQHSGSCGHGQAMCPAVGSGNPGGAVRHDRRSELDPTDELAERSAPRRMAGGRTRRTRARERVDPGRQWPDGADSGGVGEPLQPCHSEPPPERADRDDSCRAGQSDGPQSAASQRKCTDRDDSHGTGHPDQPRDILVGQQRGPVRRRIVPAVAGRNPGPSGGAVLREGRPARTDGTLPFRGWTELDQVRQLGNECPAEGLVRRRRGPPWQGRCAGSLRQQPDGFDSARTRQPCWTQRCLSRRKQPGGRDPSRPGQPRQPASVKSRCQ